MNINGEKPLAKNVLIAGGAGFIGSYIVNALSCDSKVSVCIYDVTVNNYKRGNISAVQGDIFNFGQLVRVMRHCEISSVVHLIGNPSIPSCRENPNLSFRLNVLSVQNVLEAMRLNDVNNFVFSSTASVYGKVNGLKASEDVSPKPTTVYGFHKLAAESLIKAYSEQYGINSVILRIFNVYGDLDKEQGVISIFIKKALAHEPLFLKGGRQIRDFVEIHDVVKAFIKVVAGTHACKKQIINVASGVGLPIGEVAEIIKQHFPEVKIEYKPSEGNEYSFYADVSRMKNLLKINPIDPKKGIPRFIEKCKIRETKDTKSRIKKQKSDG